MEYLSSLFQSEGVKETNRLINNATSDLLIEVNLDLNFKVLDWISQQQDPSRKIEVVQAAVKALVQKLQSPNPKVVLLSLTLWETFVLNTDDEALSSFLSNPVLIPVEELARGLNGEDCRSRAIELIFQFSGLYPKKIYPDLHAVTNRLSLLYESLEKAKPSSSSSSSSNNNKNNNNNSTLSNSEIPSNLKKMFDKTSTNKQLDIYNVKKEEDDEIPEEVLLVSEYEKLEKDTNQVKEMIKKARIESDKSQNFGSIIGEEFIRCYEFLQQVSPRILDLISSASEGLIDESYLETYLPLHDEVLELLSKMKLALDSTATTTTTTTTTTKDSSLPDLIMFDGSSTTTTTTTTTSSSVVPIL